MTTLITGVSGFIGFHVAQALFSSGKKVVGIDNLNDYYDVNLKTARLEILKKSPLFSFYKENIENKEEIRKIFLENEDIVNVIHLAAQAGVSYSLINPFAYEESNLSGLLVLLEQCRFLKKLRHFVFSSSSSVYGGSKDLPYRVGNDTDAPLSFYAATKKSGEAICHCYAHLHEIPITALRFFTVYGPWGRPDMAAFIFTKKILSGEPIDVFNNGNMRRDFTYIEDIVSGILGCAVKPPRKTNESVPFSIYNLGNSRSENLMDFIGVIESELGLQAVMNFKPMRKEDVQETYADIEDARIEFNFNPKTDIENGIPKFISWYRNFYKE